MVSLRACFLEPMSQEIRDLEDAPDLEHRIAEKYRVAAESHPAILLADTEFATALGERRAQRSFLLDEIFAADFFLAVAALSGHREALRVFEDTAMKTLVPALRRGGVKAELADEMLRTIRESMFVGTARRKPKLAVYTGQVPLLAWVRMVAQRERISTLRRKQVEIPSGEGSDFAFAMVDQSPEFVALRTSNKKLFEAALTAAVAGLDDAERVLLQLHLKEGLGIDAVGERLGVHRATAARMVVRLKRRIFDGVRTCLQEQHALGAPSIDSLCAQMADNLDLTLSRIL
jgi:RNA polymerase sigma-70 factor, ECF subfamily